MIIKVLAACGAGVNSSHQIKDALEKNMKERGLTIQCDAVMIKDITLDLISKYDIFASISNTQLGFKIPIPVVDCGPILYRIPSLATPVYELMERVITGINKT